MFLFLPDFNFPKKTNKVSTKPEEKETFDIQPEWK